MDTLTASDLIGFDGQFPYEPERSENGVGCVRIKGGRTLYEAVNFYDDRPGTKVRLSRLEIGEGPRQVNRWVDPDTELELEFVSDAS